MNKFKKFIFLLILVGVIVIPVYALGNDNSVDSNDTNNSVGVEHCSNYVDNDSDGVCDKRGEHSSGTSCNGGCQKRNSNTCGCGCQKHKSN